MSSTAHTITLLIIEDDEEYVEILGELLQTALTPLSISEKGDKDIFLAVASTPETAMKALQANDVYLATVDINLRNAPPGTSSEGMDILEQIQKHYPDTCAIILSAEDTSQHMRSALRTLGAVDFFQKIELAKKEQEFIDLLKSTLIYARAVRLFKHKLWSQAEQIWNLLLETYPNFKDNDVKELGSRLQNKKSDVTGLPGYEWVWEELKHLFLSNISHPDWAIVTVEIHNFKPFQDRDFGEAATALQLTSQILQDIRQELSTPPPSVADYFPNVLGCSDSVQPVSSIFLGEVDNTGRFLFITPSQALSAQIKEQVDKRLTKETFKPLYRIIDDKKPKQKNNRNDDKNRKHEYDTGYFVSQGQKIDLMWVSTKLVTFDDIQKPKPPSDVKEFEERVFEQQVSEGFFSRLSKSIKKIFSRFTPTP